jgi:WD40 repeat protein
VRMRSSHPADVGRGEREAAVHARGSRGRGAYRGGQPDSRFLVTGRWDETVRVWNAATGRQQHDLEPGRGAMLAWPSAQTGSSSIPLEKKPSTVTIWDAGSLQATRLLLGHTQPVKGVSVGPTGLLATTSWDGTVRLKPTPHPSRGIVSRTEGCPDSSHPCGTVQGPSSVMGERERNPARSKSR